MGPIPGHGGGHDGTTAALASCEARLGTDLISTRKWEADMAGFDYDVLVVGSGFGGSVAALRLTE